MSDGWIKLHRSLAECEDWTHEPFTRGQAWVDMLMLTNHTDGSIRVRGIVVELKRGQLGWSEEKLAKRWKWSRGKVRRFISELESKTVQRIEQQKNNVSSIITILNYDRYQSDGTANDTPNGHQTDTKRTPNGTLTRMIRRNKNEKNDKNTQYCPEFLEFWELYPRKENKGGTWKAWNIHTPDLDQIKTALAWQKRSEQWTKDQGRFIPMPASYLNGKRWEDSPKVPLAQKEAYRWPTEAEIDRIGRGYDFSDTKIASLVGFTKISDPNMIGSKKTAIEIVLTLGRQFDKEPDRFLIYAD